MYSIIIFSGFQAKASYNTNRVATANAEFVAEALALHSGVHLPCVGVWEGSTEPTHVIMVPSEGAAELAAGIMRMFRQDAVIHGVVTGPVSSSVQSVVPLSAWLYDALPRTAFTLEYSNGVKEKATSSRLMTEAKCKALGVGAYTRLPDGQCLVIEFD